MLPLAPTVADTYYALALLLQQLLVLQQLCSWIEQRKSNGTQSTLLVAAELRMNYRIYFFFFFFFCHLIYYLRPSFSLPPSRNSDPGSHSRLFSPPHYGPCLVFLWREGFSLIFPRRLASNCAYPRWALSAVDLLFFANKCEISPRQDSNSRINTITVAFEG